MAATAGTARVVSPAARAAKPDHSATAARTDQPRKRGMRLVSYLPGRLSAPGENSWWRATSPAPAGRSLAEFRRRRPHRPCGAYREGRGRVPVRVTLGSYLRCLPPRLKSCRPALELSLQIFRVDGILRRRACRPPRPDRRNRARQTCRRRCAGWLRGSAVDAARRGCRAAML